MNKTSGTVMGTRGDPCEYDATWAVVDQSVSWEAVIHHANKAAQTLSGAFAKPLDWEIEWMVKSAIQLLIGGG